MKLSSDDKTLTVTLGEDCTIIDVEADTDIIRAIPDNINKILLNIDALKELDTAYLQCIYSLAKEAQERNITIQTTGKSKIFDNVCRLYGLKKIEAFQPQKKETDEPQKKETKSKKISKKKADKPKSKKVKM